MNKIIKFSIGIFCLALFVGVVIAGDLINNDSLDREEKTIVVETCIVNGTRQSCPAKNIIVDETDYQLFTRVLRDYDNRIIQLEEENIALQNNLSVLENRVQAIEKKLK